MHLILNFIKFHYFANNNHTSWKKGCNGMKKKAPKKRKKKSHFTNNSNIPSLFEFGLFTSVRCTPNTIRNSSQCFYDQEKVCSTSTSWHKLKKNIKYLQNCHLKMTYIFKLSIKCQNLWFSKWDFFLKKWLWNFYNFLPTNKLLNGMYTSERSRTMISRTLSLLGLSYRANDF